MKRKIANYLIGFVAGLFTAPLAAIAFPFYMAWLNTRDEDKNEMRTKRKVTE